MRRSLRLPDFDYKSNGAYFVTVCVHERASLLGSVDRSTGTIQVGDVGKMCERWWTRLPSKFPAVSLDAYVIMPDHVHGLILIGCADRVRIDRPALPSVLQWFKTMTTAEYFRRAREGRWPRVNRRLWQRGFYDHVVRDERDFEAIRTYILQNPGALIERAIRGGHVGPPLQD